MRYVYYMRVSSNKQDLNMQEHAFKAWEQKLSAEEKPTSVVVIRDEGYSGKDERRPGLCKLLVAAGNGEFDVLAVYKLDRLSRRSNFALQTILKLNDLKVGFFSLSQPHLDFRSQSPFRNSMLALMSDLAQIARKSNCGWLREKNPT